MVNIVIRNDRVQNVVKMICSRPVKLRLFNGSRRVADNKGLTNSTSLVTPVLRHARISARFGERTTHAKVAVDT